MPKPRLLFKLLLSLAALAASAPAATPSAKPNVLFIAIDDLRDWAGYFGHNPPAMTPNLDRVSKMGVPFTHAGCAAWAQLSKR